MASTLLSSDKPTNSAIGRAGFIRDHGLWSDEQAAEAKALRKAVDDLGLRSVRVVWADQHGLVRGKSVPVEGFRSVLKNGMKANTGPVIMDSGSAIAFNPFMEGGGFGMDAMSGCPDLVLVPDPSTFRALPWADRTGWILCDMYFQDGTEFPFSSRQVLKRCLRRLEERNLELVAGLEIEWHLTKLVDPKLSPADLGAPGAPGTPPEVLAVTPGYQYQSEVHNDEIEPILSILQDQLMGAGLPLRTLEDEWGPSQMEFTFSPQGALEAADSAVLFRSATRQIARRNGYHATFMCRPGLPGFFSSGWHMHMSLEDAIAGRNAFMPLNGGGDLSEDGLHFVGGLIEHARAASVFVTPTVNGYKRFKPYSLAPDRAQWGRENRGSMIRVAGGAGDPSTHLENRAGEPAANPYLYIGSQVVAGLDGVDRRLDPGPDTDSPYEADRVPLPTTLGEAIDALDGSKLYREAFGEPFVEYVLGLKRSEWGRFVEANDGRPEAEYLAEVTDWEQREYFQFF